MAVRRAGTTVSCWENTKLENQGCSPPKCPQSDISKNECTLTHIMFVCFFLFLGSISFFISCNKIPRKEVSCRFGSLSLFVFSLVCEKSLTLWFFHSFLIILVLAPQFYPRCIASKERKTERESKSWLKRHVWWMSIQIKTKTK